MLYSNLPLLALPIKGAGPIPGDHLSHNLVFRILFFLNNIISLLPYLFLLKGVLAFAFPRRGELVTFIVTG